MTFLASSTNPSYARTQSVYDIGEVGVTTALWRSLSVRGPSSWPVTNQARTVGLVVSMSVSPLSYEMTTSTFASNHGPTSTVLLNGQVALPTRSPVAMWPAPWEPILFTAPFAFVAPLGKSLVVDLTQTSNSGAANTSWLLEATSVPTFFPVTNPPSSPSCKFASGGPPQYTPGVFPVPGVDWRLEFSGLPSMAHGIFAFGRVGSGTTWGGLQLPIDLGPFGAPSCSWNVGTDLTIPVQGDATGRATATLKLPSDPTLGGSTFYDQAAFVDPQANALGLVTSWSRKWTVAYWAGRGVTVVQSGTASANGVFFPTMLTTLMLQ